MATLFLLKHLPGKRKRAPEQSGEQQSSSFMQRLFALTKWLRREIVSRSLLCAAIASAFCILLKDSTIEAQTPLLFLIVILAIAGRFGTSAGVLGTLISALVFAEFLFDPLRSLAISNPLERSNIGWMILGGLALACLFGRSPKSMDRERRDDTAVPS
jgi:K+-sensing histidine kinase KdpD